MHVWCLFVHLALLFCPQVLVLAGNTREDVSNCVTYFRQAKEECSEAKDDNSNNNPNTQNTELRRPDAEEARRLQRAEFERQILLRGALDRNERRQKALGTLNSAKAMHLSKATTTERMEAIETLFAQFKKDVLAHAEDDVVDDDTDCDDAHEGYDANDREEEEIEDEFTEKMYRNFDKNKAMSNALGERRVWNHAFVSEMASRIEVDPNYKPDFVAERIDELRRRVLIALDAKFRKYQMHDAANNCPSTTQAKAALQQWATQKDFFLFDRRLSDADRVETFNGVIFPEFQRRLKELLKVDGNTNCNGKIRCQQNAGDVLSQRRKSLKESRCCARHPMPTHNNEPVRSGTPRPPFAVPESTRH